MWPPLQLPSSASCPLLRRRGRKHLAYEGGQVVATPDGLVVAVLLVRDVIEPGHYLALEVGLLNGDVRHEAF